MSVTKTAAEITEAVATVSTVLKARNSGDAGALLDASAVFAHVADCFNYEIRNAPTKTVSGANAAAFFTAASIAAGDIFKVADTTDTTDDALETAKGSAPAAGDVFQRVSSAVVFVVAAAGLSVDSAFRE